MLNQIIKKIVMQRGEGKPPKILGLCLKILKKIWGFFVISKYFFIHNLRFCPWADRLCPRINLSKVDVLSSTLLPPVMSPCNSLASSPVACLWCSKLFDMWIWQSSSTHWMLRPLSCSNQSRNSILWTDITDICSYVEFDMFVDKSEDG